MGGVDAHRAYCRQRGLNSGSLNDGRGRRVSVFAKFERRAHAAYGIDRSEIPALRTRHLRRSEGEGKASGYSGRDNTSGWVG
jgi:hypothetical protein